MRQNTLSVWTVVLNNREAFVNAGYKETREPLWPSLAPTKVNGDEAGREWGRARRASCLLSPRRRILAEAGGGYILEPTRLLVSS